MTRKKTGRRDGARKPAAKRRRLRLDDRVEPARTFLALKAILVDAGDSVPVAAALAGWFGVRALGRPAGMWQAGCLSPTEGTLGAALERWGTGGGAHPLVLVVSDGDGPVGPEVDACHGVRAMLACERRTVMVDGQARAALCLATAVHEMLLDDKGAARQFAASRVLRACETHCAWLDAVEWPTPGEEIRGGLSLLETDRVQAGSLEEEIRWRRYQRVLDGQVPERVLRIGTAVYLRRTMVERAGMVEKVQGWLEEGRQADKERYFTRLFEMQRGWHVVTCVDPFVPSERVGRQAGYDWSDGWALWSVYEQMREAGLIL